MIPFPDVSPDIFSVNLFGMDFALRWYALAYIVGIVIGWRIVVATLKRPKFWGPAGAPMTPRQCEELLTWVILGVILGGRLGYVLFYKPGDYLTNPTDILKIWQGGMAFHGGLLGVIVAAWIVAHRERLPKLSTADAMALGIWPGLLLGRIANFINAELWGRQTDLPWGVVFPRFYAQECGLPEDVFCARHPSQLYEALLEGVVLGVVLLWMAWKRDALKFPGRVSGTFFAGYGLARFVVEFVRQPDLQFVTEGNPLGLAYHIGGYGLTMGQVLSLPMILGGLWLILRAKHV